MKVRMTKDEKKAIWFVFPGVIVTGFLIVYPLFYIVAMSFSENSLGQNGFAGLTNYVRLLRNPQFPLAIRNTLRFTAVTGILSYAIGLLLAVLVHQKAVRLKGIWRSLIFIAWVIPGVVKATAWKWMFQTENGIINHMLQSLHIISGPIPWLTSPQYALWSITIVQVWACSPYVMLLMTAGLQQIPADIYESADLDGANALQKLARITLPMLRDISFICILTLLVWTLNEFSLIWIMTSGGQGTVTLSILIYNQFKVLNLNASSASAVMQLIITMIFAGVYVKLIAKDD